LLDGGRHAHRRRREIEPIDAGRFRELDTALDLAYAVEKVADDGPIGAAERSVERGHLVHDRVEETLVLGADAVALVRIGAAAEELEEHAPRVVVRRER